MAEKIFAYQDQVDNLARMRVGISPEIDSRCDSRLNSKAYTHAQALALPIIHLSATAVAVATQWAWSYNHDRPHIALGGFTLASKRLDAT